MKICVVFEKRPRLRFIGHLDLMRTMQRALRRSNLPVCYSQGFNPHILLSFAAPLSVGYAGKREIMELPVQKDVTVPAFESALQKALPPDLNIVQVSLVNDDHPAYMALMKAAGYEIAADDGTVFDEAVLRDFLAQQEIMTLKKTKSGEKECDIRPLILGLSVKGSRMSAVLSASSEATLKPETLLQALREFTQGRMSPHVQITRTQLWGFRGTGVLTPLEQL